MLRSRRGTQPSWNDIVIAIFLACKFIFVPWSCADVVLGWRLDYQPLSSHTFNRSGDVRMFLFYFKNVVVSRKIEIKNSFKLLGHLAGNALELFFDQFNKRGSMSPEGPNLALVEVAFLEKLGMNEDFQDIVCNETNPTINLRNLKKSLAKLDTMYYRAGLNEEAKFGFLCMNAMQIPQVATFDMYKGVANYAVSKKAIHKYYSGVCAFHSTTMETGVYTADGPKI